MVSVVPSGSIIFCQNVPLDNTYQDTLTFATASAQQSYFQSKQKYAMTDCTYVRSENYIHAALDAEQAKSCNYIMFQNNGFSAKWYYAFITDIQFASSNASRIYFELDVMQTWMFDYTVKPSFVVREHTNNDSIGANLIPERLEYGDNIIVKSKSTDLTDMRIVMAYVSENEHDSYNQGLYSGCEYFITSASQEGAGLVDAMIATLTTAGKLDSIAGIFMVPAFMAGTGAGSIFLEYAPDNSTIDGYTPRNNKLFTYPYCYTAVTNYAGGEAIYKHEYFNTPNILSFQIDGCLSMQPTAQCTPQAYKGQTKNWDEGIQLSAFPQCTWISNNFANWIALNSKQIEVTTWANNVNALTNLSSSSSVVSSITGIQKYVAMLEDKKKTPSTLAGHVNNASFNMSQGLIGFTAKNYQIKSEFAQIIDNYFTMFGYQTNRLKVPNITGRSSWNYVQTQKCMATGTVPFNDLSMIRNIFDRGITFWHGDYVGDYSRANGVV